MRVLLADGQSKVRSASRLLLEQEPGMSLVGEAVEAEDLLALAVIAWMRGYWSLVSRLYYSLIALASVLFVLFAGYWNMLGWRF